MHLNLLWNGCTDAQFRTLAIKSSWMVISPRQAHQRLPQHYLATNILDRKEPKLRQEQKDTVSEKKPFFDCPHVCVTEPYKILSPEELRFIETTTE